MSRREVFLLLLLLMLLVHPLLLLLLLVVAADGGVLILIFSLQLSKKRAKVIFNDFPLSISAVLSEYLFCLSCFLSLFFSSSPSASGSLQSTILCSLFVNFTDLSYSPPNFCRWRKVYSRVELIVLSRGMGMWIVLIEDMAVSLGQSAEDI